MFTNDTCIRRPSPGHTRIFSASMLNATIGDVFYTPQPNKTLPELPEWQALSHCCADPKNVTQLTNANRSQKDCSLWCVLAPAKFPPTHDDDTTRRDLAECINANGGRTTPAELNVWRPKEYLHPMDPAPTTTKAAPRPTDGGAAATQTPGPNSGPVLGVPSLKGAGLLLLVMGIFQMTI